MTTLPLLTEGMSLVEAALTDSLGSDVETLASASRHITTSGGKRVRPRILMLAYLACGGRDIATAAPLAAAIEMVHTATLVHDDINDHSVVRRGKVAVHAKYGRTFALLTGDYMFATVYQMMAPYSPALNQVMSNAAVRLVEGETLQALAAKTGDMSRETYKAVIERKTASLFEAAGRMGAIHAGADAATVEALGNYGRYLGMAFQIVDDILDVVGDPEALGKPTGLDVEQQRGVFVAENGNGAHVKERDPIEALRSKMRNDLTLRLARAQAAELGDRARRALADLPPSPARDRLYAWVDMVLDRDH